jgi:hypothetical protein
VYLRTMNKFLITLLLIGFSSALYGQDDDTVQFIQGLPVMDEDTVQHVPQPDVAPYQNKQSIKPQQLPHGVRNALNKNDLFANWQKEEILFDKNTGLYWIHFNKDNKVSSYGFNSRGDIVSLKEADAGK